MRTTSMMVEALLELRHQPGGVPHEQFWQLVERFRADLINQAFAILGNQADAEDVAQDALCRAYVDLHKLQDPRKLGAWLRKINRCHAIDLLRRRKAAREERLATGEAAALTKTRFPRRRATPATANRPRPTASSRPSTRCPRPSAKSWSCTTGRS